jgi:hypothetical protein
VYTITWDTAHLETQLGQLTNLLAKSPNVPEEVVRRLLNLAESGAPVGAVESCTTMGTGEIRIVLQLSEAFLELAATIGALECSCDSI